MESGGLPRAALSTGAAQCGIAIAAGAFGAHALRGQIGAAELGLWETAVRYLLYGAIGELVIGVATERLEPVAGRVAFISVLAGSWIFFLTIAGLALGAPRWLGAVTPIGGLGMIAGYCALAFAAWRSR